MIADLHLDAQNEMHLAMFERFMKTVAAKHEELVILGDFFDYWVGDDAISTVSPIIKLLKDFTAQGKKLYLTHGNRDFMIGETFAATVGATLLADPCVAKIGDRAALIAHGDIWCTKDLDYQAVRRRVRGFFWQWLVLRYPLEKRLTIARTAKNQSATQKKTKSAQDMDVVNEAIISDLTDNISWVIHGHTHRPGVYKVNDKVCRFVLPDWHFKPGFKAGYLIFEAGTPKLSDFCEND